MPTAKPKRSIAPPPTEKDNAQIVGRLLLDLIAELRDLNGLLKKGAKPWR